MASSTTEIRKGRLSMVLAAILWGLAGICVKAVSWSSMSLIAARSLLSLFILFGVKRSFRLRFTKWNIIGAVFMSVTGMLYVQAIKLTTAGTAIVLQYIAPILVLLYMVFFRQRKIRVSEILITLAVFAGIILSFYDSLDPSRILGNVLGVLSGFTFAGQIIVMSREDTDKEDSLIISCILSFLFAFPFMLRDPELVWDIRTVLWVLAFGLLQYGTANALFGYGIRRLDNVEASLILTIEPVFNPIPVAIFLGERMGLYAILGSVIVIFFVTLYGLLPRLRERLRLTKDAAASESGKIG